MKYALVVLLSVYAFAADLRIVPYPREVSRQDGRMTLRGTVTIAVSSNDPEDRFAAGLLKEEIESATHAKAKVARGSSGQIVLVRGSKNLGPEEYTIEA